MLHDERARFDTEGTSKRVNSVEYNHVDETFDNEVL